jgi:hypothetical protein
MTPLSHRLANVSVLNFFQDNVEEWICAGFGRNHQWLLIRHLTYVKEVDFNLVQVQAIFWRYDIVNISFTTKKIAQT